MIKLDMKGKVCPIPVLETKKIIKGLKGKETILVTVDNGVAVSNLTNMSKDFGFQVSYKEISPKEFEVSINADVVKDNIQNNCQNKVVVISSDTMGIGDEKLGINLMKAFIFTMSQKENKPNTILFYNRGAFLTTDGSLSIEDLQNLEKEGVEILTCGTCLNFYNLTEKLKVGKVTNMEVIYEKQINADIVVRP